MHQYFSCFERRILESLKTLSENFSTVLFFCFCFSFSQLCIGIPYLPVYINAHPIFQDGFQNIDLNIFFGHLTLSLYHSILSSHKTFGTEKIIDKYPQCSVQLSGTVLAQKQSTCLQKLFLTPKNIFCAKTNQVETATYS